MREDIHQRPHPVSTRTPQTAATPKVMTKATAISRPAVVLLLQPWSTPASQTKKRRMQSTLMILSHIGLLPDQRDMSRPRSEAPASLDRVICGWLFALMAPGGQAVGRAGYLSVPSFATGQYPKTALP
jgi:hypothetical protein